MSDSSMWWCWRPVSPKCKTGLIGHILFSDGSVPVFLLILHKPLVCKKEVCVLRLEIWFMWGKAMSRFSASTVVKAVCLCELSSSILVLKGKEKNLTFYLEGIDFVFNCNRSAFLRKSPISTTLVNLAYA